MSACRGCGAGWLHTTNGYCAACANDYAWGKPTSSRIKSGSSPRAPHPECLHPRTNASDDYSGAYCCCCPGERPCEAVTVEFMAAHRDYDLALFGEVSFVPTF